jgi:hypothetical protein
MVWAEDVMAGRMGSAVIRGNSVGGGGFIAEVNLFCDQGGSTYWDVCSRVIDECMEGWSWRLGVEGVRAGDAATTKAQQRFEKENEVVDAKMRKNEVVTMGAETMSVDEKTRAMQLVVTELVVATQLMATDCVGAGCEWTIASSVVQMFVQMRCELDGVREWEMLRKWFELAQSVAVMGVSGMAVGAVLADLTIFEALSIWSAHKKNEKTAVKAAADAAEKAVESDSGAAEAAAEAVVVRVGKLRDLEALTIGSDPINNTSDAANKEKAVDTTAEFAMTLMCPLVAAMLAVETTKAAEAEKEKAAAIVAEDATAAATAEDQRWQKMDQYKSGGEDLRQQLRRRQRRRLNK